jgi:hypothetical protein
MPTLEERVRLLESRLGGGLLGLQPGDAELRSDLDLLKTQVSQIRNQQRNGNVFGGMIRTEIGPGFTFYGPLIRDVDASFPLDFLLHIPEYILRISSCALHVVPRPVRSSVSVAEDIGSITSDGGTLNTSEASSQSSSGASTSSSSGASSSSSSGASSSSTSDGGGSHSHSLSGNSTAVSTHQHTGSTGAPDPVEGGSGHDHLVITSFDGGHSHGLSGATAASNGSHDHGMAHNHGIAHTHGISHTHGIDHFHDINPHTHDVAGHGHDLTLAISEGGSASGITLLIDGIDRTSALGGPWDDAFEVDIRQYLVDARQMPLTGHHTIQLTSATVGALELHGDLYGVVRPPV